MSSGKKTSINVPTFEKPPVPSFSIPGYGTASYANNTYGFSPDAGQEDYMNQLKALRGSILSGLALTSPERVASLNEWQDTFQKEALRSTMPQLEQTLFARGLGGSEFYKGAVNDLLSKVATQSVLSREDLARQDQLLKLEQLASISGLNQQEFANIAGLLGLSQGAGYQDANLAQNRYLATLPYTTTVTNSNNGLAGALQGALQGAQYGSAAGPWGALLGAGAGGLTGYAGSRGSTTTPYALYNTDGGSSANWLQYLNQLQPVRSSTSAWQDASRGFRGSGYARYPDLYKTIYGV